MARWEAARVARLRAFSAFGRLCIVAQGEKPTPCHVVDIVQSPIMIFPPHYGVRWRQQGSCTEQVTPFTVGELFHFIGSDVITVHTAEGPQTVKIEKPGFRHSLFAADKEADSTAVGYSKNWDFGEALRDAIENLPERQPSGIADELFTFEVVETGALVGGIVPFNHMYVKVRQT
jgi:hypothetical protein